jgi:hypothetical protein
MTKNPVHIILIYRPPNSGKNNLDLLCELIENSQENTILVGDFNLPEIDWARKTSGNRGKKFLEATINANFEQLVTFPTHNKGNTLDLVLSNCPARIQSVEEAGKLGNSDHVAIEINVEINVERAEIKKKCKLWKNANYEEMNADFRRTDWNRQLLNLNAEEAWNKFRSILDSCIEKHVPTIEIIDNGRPRWLTKEIVNLIRRKKKAWKAYRLYRTAELAERYEKLEKEVKNKIKKAKRKLERDLARDEDRNGKKFTAYIKSKTKTKTGIGPLKKDGGGVTADNKEMADILNKFMAGVFTKENTSNIPTKERETEYEISDLIITTKLIEEKIDNLKSDSAPGPDGIHPRLLKEMKKSVSVPLQIIFQKSIDTGIVPADWRRARVVPIYKKGARGDPGNYRPVS